MGIFHSRIEYPEDVRKPKKRKGPSKMSLSVVWNNEQDEHEINGDLIELLERLLQTAGKQKGLTRGSRSDLRQ